MTLEVRTVITLGEYLLLGDTRDHSGVLQPPTAGSLSVLHHFSLVSLNSSPTFITSPFIYLSPILLKEPIISDRDLTESTALAHPVLLLRLSQLPLKSPPPQGPTLPGPLLHVSLQ